MILIEPVADGIRFSVKVQPRSKASELAGTFGSALKVRLQAPPVDGAANEALVELLAQSLGVPRRDIRILHGEHSRLKSVEVRGVSASAALERLLKAR